MRIHWLLLCAAVAAVAIPSAADVRITVSSPSQTGRTGEPVAVPWADVLARLPGAAGGPLLLTDEEGRPVPVQVDDLDADGTPDELAFRADFAPLQVRVFDLRASTSIPDVMEPFRTDAQNWKRVGGVLKGVDDDDLAGDRRERSAYRFDGVGWESETAAYRLYLDGRNAVDVQGKRKPGLYWKWIGESGVDYQVDAEWGMDVLHVGPALGVGGIAFRVGDSVQKPLSVDRQRCRVIARGPVRAVVRVEYRGWRIGSAAADVVSLFVIYAGDRVSEHRVTVTDPYATLVAGIVKHDSTERVWREEEGLLYTVGHQSRANDTLLLAVQADPRHVRGVTEDPVNHLILLRTDAAPVRLLLGAWWQGEAGGAWRRDAVAAEIRAAGRRLAEPLTIEVR